MANTDYRAIGLTEEQARALVEHAATREHELSWMSDYDRRHSEYAVTSLKRAVSAGNISAEQLPELLALIRIRQSDDTAMFLPLKANIRRDEERGFHEAHPSFGCASQRNIRSTQPSFVGTPSMDHTVIGLAFSTASLRMSEFSKEEPRLSSHRTLYEIYLSADQFAGLLRNKNASSPCAISRSSFCLVDQPPRLVNSVTIAASVKARASEILNPLKTAAKVLRDAVDGEMKISSKTDYAEVKKLVDEVKLAYDQARQPLIDLLAETAGLMAESTTRQLLADIAEPLKQLGMDDRSIRMLTQH